MSIVHKATAAAVGPDLEFVLSDATVDRMGDVVDPAGWDLKWFRKNPIALFGHSSGFPIGTWTDIRVEGGKLMARLRFASEGTSQRIDELRRLVEQGVLRAVSVSFRAIQHEPMDPKDPYGGQRFLKSELLECSLVSVPANPAALALAKGLSISDDVMTLAFGEHAERDARIVRRTASGEHAAPRKSAPGKGTTMKLKLSERVEKAQQAFVAARDAYNDHIGEDDFDIEVAEGLEATMKDAEARLSALERAERSLAARAERDGGNAGHAAPAVSLKGRQKDVDGFDLIVRAMTVRGIAHFGPQRKSIDQVLDERYKGHEATEIVTKADQTIGTTTGSHWADDLVRTAYGDFLNALTGVSIYPRLRDRGIGLSFDGNGTVSIPSRTAGGAGGGFFAEGDPIRVGRVTTASTTMTSRQLGVIVPFTRKLATQSTPSIEGVVRNAILEDTAANIDSALLDATASSTARPAGLLNGVSATASGYGGGDQEAVIEDFKALLAPFIAANAADNITVIMNPAQALSISLKPDAMGNFGWFSEILKRITVVESTYATAGRLIAIRNSDFATALGDAPQFDISEQATIHMEDTTPLEIVSGTGPTAADPVRSLWQTASIGVRMIMDVSWKMRRTGMVQWINGTSY